MIGGDEIVALGGGNEAGESLPRLGKQRRGAVFVEPVDFAFSRGEHAAQHQRVDALAKVLRVE